MATVILQLEDAGYDEVIVIGDVITDPRLLDRIKGLVPGQNVAIRISYAQLENFCLQRKTRKPVASPAINLQPVQASGLPADLSAFRPGD